MVAPYATAVQNGNKCPHGLPMGACPICNGMGGGSMKKDRDTARRPGEMTYNECMAAWIKIQAAQDAKIQAKIDRLEMLQQRTLESKMIQGLDKIQKNVDKLMQNIENLPNIARIPAKIIMNVIVQPILNLISQIPKAINFIQSFFNDIARFITSVSEKLATVLGEIKNFIDAKVIQTTKKAIKTILSLFVNKEEDGENEEVEKTKLKKVKDIFKSIFKTKKRQEEEQLEKDDK